jgi:hypothetical protein
MNITDEEVQRWYYEDRVTKFEENMYYFENTMIGSERGICFVQQELRSDVCPQCFRKLSIYSNNIERTSIFSSIRDFIPRVLLPYASEREKSLWSLFISHPQFNSLIESLKSYLHSSTLFLIGNMYNDGRILWFSFEECHPYENTLFAIFNWMIEKCNAYFKENMHRITYAPLHVVKKIKNDGILNFIDLEHPELLMHQQYIERNLREYNNESKELLLQTIKNRINTIAKNSDVNVKF